MGMLPCSALSSGLAPTCSVSPFPLSQGFPKYPEPWNIYFIIYYFQTLLSWASSLHPLPLAVIGGPCISGILSVEQQMKNERHPTTIFLLVLPSHHSSMVFRTACPPTLGLLITLLLLLLETIPQPTAILPGQCFLFL